MVSNWNEYMEEIYIATRAMREQKLEHDPNHLSCDFFTIPSHNHYCFYARIYLPERLITYARSEIDDWRTGTVIKMYPFSDAVKAGKRGRIVCGERKMDMAAVETLQSICEKLPPEVMLGEDDRIVLDGVVQMIRVYENGAVVKKAVFINGDKPVIGDLYLLLEEQIRG